jgi:TM2 domain-containing membrane protein YozV
MNAKGELMNFFESKATSKLFLCSAVLFLSLCAFTCALAIPGVSQFLNASPTKNLLVILFGALAVIGIPSMLLVFFGMAIFCACIDRSSILKKVCWFVLFLGTGPVGSTVYYFAVYRGYLKRKRTGGPGLNSETGE